MSGSWETVTRSKMAEKGVGLGVSFLKDLVEL